jgi:FKBP-type peptidyl-prolyl cis-trans isomerase FkpA
MRPLLNIIFFSSFIVFFSCGTEKPKEKPHYAYNEKAIKDQFVKANQALTQKENDDMDSYVSMHHMAFVKTNSGVRYFVYKPSLKGDSIKQLGDSIRNENVIKADFTVSLLDGTECYSTAKEGARTIVVGHEDIESGLQIGLQYLKKGDKAIILIPSHLAHGLLGDMNKIPPQTPIVYDIQIHEE